MCLYRGLDRSEEPVEFGNTVPVVGGCCQSQHSAAVKGVEFLDQPFQPATGRFDTMVDVSDIFW